MVDFGSECPPHSPESTDIFFGIPVSVNGNWSTWSDWSLCSAGCGPGKEYRIRVCDNPPPAYNGLNCSGPNEESRDCNLTPCPGAIKEAVFKMTFQRLQKAKPFHHGCQTSISQSVDMRWNGDPQ